MSECNHPPPAAKTLEQIALEQPVLAAFYRYLARTEGLTVEFMVGAFQGYTAREHVDECHPGEVEDAFDKWMEQMTEGPKRSGWIAGYRFKEGREQAHMQAETKGEQ